MKAINKSKNPQKREAAIKILGRVPITEEEAMQLSMSEWKKPDYRNNKLKEWGQFASAKFKEAKQTAR